MRGAHSKTAFLFSVCMHVAVLIVLIASFEFSAPMPVVSNTDTQIVNAVALKDSPVLAPPRKAVVEQLPAQPAKQELPLPQPELAQLEKRPPVKIAKKDISKQLLADLEDAIAQQAKVKQKQTKNKFKQALKAQSEKALQQWVKEQQLASQRSQHTQGVINKYKALVLQAIGQQWIVPSRADQHLSCELLIRLAPGGIVLDVHVTKSSGDTLLDRSARAAVFKASPLPVPDDVYSFEVFRQFVLKVKPENVLENHTEQL